jgi:hypothetical protein
LVDSAGFRCRRLEKDLPSGDTLRGGFWFERLSPLAGPGELPLDYPSRPGAGVAPLSPPGGGTGQVARSRKSPQPGLPFPRPPASLILQPLDRVPELLDRSGRHLLCRLLFSLPPRAGEVGAVIALLSLPVFLGFSN